MRVHTSIALFAALALSATAAHAGAGNVMYGTNHLIDGSTTDPDQLIRFDPNNPSGYQVVGSLGVDGIGFGGLAFDAAGTLWAYASFFKFTGGAAGGLYRVNPDTGEATVQGTKSSQSLQDLAYNPVNNRMYGINTQGPVSSLYEVNLASGAVTKVGDFSDLLDSAHLQGFGIDSNGTMYIQDVSNDVIYSGSGLDDLTVLYDLPQDTNFSQGIDIDWSRDDLGYHGAVGYGDFPNFFSQINTFTTDGSSYALGDIFGPNDPDGLPPVEAGDLAMRPVPGPGALAMLGLGGLVSARRRRRNG